MKTEIIKIGEQIQFLKVELIPVTQNSKQFYLGKVNANEFLNIYTVRPAEYDVHKHTELAKSFNVDSEYYQFLAEKDAKAIRDKNFQREYDPTRVKKIANFLMSEEFPFFPNTIIATCDLINNIDQFEIDVSNSFDEYLNLANRPNHLSFLQYKDEVYNLYIPYSKDLILVIDGQHRLKGLEKTNLDFKNTYELLISFIIDFDRSVIAKLFYTINYEQKSVNKSLLYHLTGEFSTELDELTFMHNVVRVLNELDYSPFYRKIKMLGSNPKSASFEEKRHLTISQAFLIDSLLRTISINSKNSLFQPIFLFYYQNRELQIEIIRFLIKYFNVVKYIKKTDWDEPETSILTKGIGITALIKVLNFVFIKLFVDGWGLNPSAIKDINQDQLVFELNGLKNVDFSRQSEFGGVGSAGTINKLTMKIIENLELSKGKSYEVFINEFKSTQWIIFKNWLSNNIKSI